MSWATIVFTTAALCCLSSLAEASVGTSDSCGGQDLQDEMSLLQVQQVVEPMKGRISVQDASHSAPRVVKNGLHVTKRIGQHVEEEMEVLHPDVSTEAFTAEGYAHPEGDSSLFVAVNSSATMTERFIKEIEFELGKTKYETQTANKILIVLLELFVCPGLCGIDRCCMGQTCMGIVKGCTFGGFFIWFLIDFAIITINSLSSSENINLFGFVVNWEKHSVNPAFMIAVVWLVCLCCGGFIVSAVKSCFDVGGKQEDATGVPGWFRFDEHGAANIPVTVIKSDEHVHASVVSK